MPIMDKELLLCESMSITAATTAGTAVPSTNVVYIPQVKNFKGTAMNDRVNVSGNLHLNIVCEDESLATSSGTSTVTFALYNDDTATPVDSGAAVITSAISQGSSGGYTDGKQICSIALPAGQLEPYFELKVSVATANLSTGKITAWIGGPVQQGV